MANNNHIANNLLSSMPTAPPNGNGLFVPEGVTGPYSNHIGENDIVGTATIPYLPANLPAYIPTLYRNIRRIENELPAAVNEQISKYLNTQFLAAADSPPTNTNPFPESTDAVVRTNVENTIIVGVSTDASKNASYIPVGGSSTKIAIYRMDPKSASLTDTSYDLYRFGCSKLVMFTATTWLDKAADGTAAAADGKNAQLAFLYAGDDGSFIINGQLPQKYYQFRSPGDFVRFTMLPAGPNWNFHVTEYSSVFSPTILTTGTTTITGLNFTPTL